MTMQRLYDLKSYYPGLLDLDNTTILGEGHYGLVADRGDGTVLKLIVGYKKTSFDASAMRIAGHEWSVIKKLDELPHGDLQIPRPTGEMISLNMGPFLAALPMTKIIDESKNPATRYLSQSERHYAMGRLLAKFQRVAMPLTQESFMNTNTKYKTYHTIPIISDLTDVANKALNVADEYLREYAPSGLVHGDFKENNFFLYGEGVCDFESTYACTNIMTDFLNDNLDENAEPAIEGYEQELGIKLDKFLLRLTRVSRYAHARNKNADVQPYLERALLSISDLTGYTPPGL